MFKPDTQARAVCTPGQPVRRATAPVALTGACMLSALLSGCAGPSAPVPAPVDAPKPSVAADSVEKFQVSLGDGFMLNYQLEKKISKVNGKSCFAFITGHISNQSGKGLARRSVLDVAVYSQGALLYRDLSHPVADIRSGFHADFEMVVSPLFADGCPRFDKIDTALRKVYL